MTQEEKEAQALLGNSQQDLSMPADNTHIDEQEAQAMLNNSKELDSVAPKYSKMDSFKAGVVQGGTLGFGDELAGGMNVGFDKTQALLNKLGLASPSPSQVDEQLLQQGATGDLNPDMYTPARDQVRAENKAKEDANFKSYLAGNILGGAVPMAAAGTFAAPFKIADNASKLAKIGLSAANAIPASAVTAYGMTNADTLPEQAKDVAIGTGLGVGLGAAVPAVGMGLKYVGQKAGDITESLAPDLAHYAKRGAQGVQAWGKDFVENNNSGLGKYADTMANFLKTKRDVLNQTRQKALEGVDSEMANLDASLADEMNLIKSGLNLSKENERQALMKDINSQSVKSQNYLQKTKKNVGKVYDNLEKEIQDKNITFNVNDEIAGFGEDLQMAGLQPDEAIQFQKKFLPEFEQGNLSLNELRNVKNKLAGLFNSGKPEVRKAAKMAYGRINDKQVNILGTAGDIDLANSMKDANQRYKAILQLEEDYVGQITPNRVTGTIEPSNEMQKTVGSFSTSKPNAKDFRTQEEFQKLAQVADPEFAQQSTSELNKLGGQLKANETLDTAGPDLNHMQDTSNRYQDLLKQKELLSQRPVNNTQYDKFVNTDATNDIDKNVKDYLTKNFKNTTEKLDTVGKQDINSIINAYEQETGKTVSDDIRTLAKDAKLIKTGEDGTKGIGLQTIGTLKSLVGAPINSIAMVPSAIKNNTSTIRNVIFDDVNNVLNNLRKFRSPEAEIYAKQIEQATQGSKQTKDALYFSLMQQPQFRQMMRKDKVDESKP